MEIRKMSHLYSPADPEPSTTIRCEDCGKAHYDENYAGEACRECGAILPY